jgi:hypothetical protein
MALKNPALKGNKYARAKRSERARKAAAVLADDKSKGVKKSAYQQLIELGYSKWSARKPKRATSTLSFQEEVKQNGVLDTMKESQALASTLLASRLQGNKHEGPLLISTSELIGISKGLVHDIQLLSGAETDRIGANVKNMKQLGDVLKELSKKS